MLCQDLAVWALRTQMESLSPLFWKWILLLKCLQREHYKNVSADGKIKDRWWIWSLRSSLLKRLVPSSHHTTFRITPLLFGCSMAGLTLASSILILIAVVIAAACGRRYGNKSVCHGVLIRSLVLGVPKEEISDLLVITCVLIQLMVNRSRRRSLMTIYRHKYIQPH